MDIKAINSLKFNGVFTDKKWHNMGNWRMEYSPYSWESNNSSRMTKKEKVNLLASYLPDNEEIYKAKTEGYYRTFESSEDILGTVSYYKDFKKDDMRKQIIEVPAMDRETSLDVLRKKLEKFMGMKREYGEQIQKDIETNMSNINRMSSDYTKISNDYDAGFFSAENSKSRNKVMMDTHNSNIVEESKKMHDSSKNYAILRNSMDELRIKIESIKYEIERLKEARVSKNLIDISKRDIYDPNKALWDALQDIRTAYGKLVALPHKTTSINELISEANVKLTDEELPKKIIKFVDELIKKRI